MKRFLFSLSFPIFLLLSACGQSGPLYLPNHQAPLVQPTHHH